MNKNEYKRAMSSIQPSEQAVERIMDIPNKKSRNVKSIIRRTAAATLALAVVAGSGFGINNAVLKSNADKPLSVMVAYAGDEGKLQFGKKSRQPIFYGIYTAPINDKKACKEAYERWNADTAKVYAYSDEKDKDESASYGKGSSACQNTTTYEETAVFYTLQAGEFSLNLEDYTDVKSFKVENKSKYGWLSFDYETKENYEFAQWQNELWEKYNVYDGGELPPEVEQQIEDRAREISGFIDDEECFTLEMQEKALGLAHEYKLTGDELRFSQRYGYYEHGLGKYKENKGYYLEWEPSFELKNAIGDNPSFDLSQVKDTIIFTVEFNDGTVKTASLDLYFDSDGYMHFGNQ